MKNLTLIFTLLFMSSISALAKERIYTIELNEDSINFNTLQDYHVALKKFTISVETDKKAKKKYTIINSIISKAYASGGKCYFAGHASTSYKSNAKRNKGKVFCRVPQSKRCDGILESQKVHCSPEIFGPGKDGKGPCVSVSSQNGAKSCSNLSKATSTPQIVKNLLNDPKALSAFSKKADEIESFCKERESSPSCKDLKERIAKIKADLDTAKKVKSGEASVDRKPNWAIGVMQACEDNYRKEEDDNVFGAFFMSQRQIGSGVLSHSCSANESVQSITDSDFNNLKGDLDKVANETHVDSLLTDGLKLGVELSVKNYLHHALVSGDLTQDNAQKIINDLITKRPELGKAPYKKILVDASNDFKESIKNKKLEKPNLEELADNTNDLIENLDKQCEEINKKFPCQNWSMPMATGYGYSVGMQTSYTEPANSCGRVRRSSDYKNYIATRQAKYFATIDNHVKSNPHFSKYYATPKFRNNYFNPKSDFAKDCSTDKDISDKSAGDGHISARTFKNLNDEVSKEMKDDLEDLAKKISDDDKLDALQELMKYRPHLIGKAFKDNRAIPGLQDVQSQFICKQMRDIYNSDERWRLTDVSVGVAGLAISGVLIGTGVGSPFGVALAAANTALIAGDAVLAVNKYNDASNRQQSNNAAIAQSLIDAQSATLENESVDSLKTEAYIQGGASVVGVAADGVTLMSKGKGLASVTRQTGKVSQSSDVVVGLSKSSDNVVDVTTSTSKALAVSDDAISSSKGLAVVSNSDNALVVTKANASTKTALVSTKPSGTISEIPTVMRKPTGAGAHFDITLSSGKSFNVNSKVSMLDDGSAIAISKGSKAYDSLIDANVGKVADNGDIILKPGLDMDSVVIHSKATTPDGSVIKGSDGRAVTNQANYSFNPDNITSGHALDNLKVTNSNQLDSVVEGYNNLPKGKKIGLLNTIETKIANGEKLNDVDLIVMARRDGVSLSSETAKSKFVDLIQSRDPSKVKSVVGGESGRSLTRRSNLSSAVESGQSSALVTTGNNLPVSVASNTNELISNQPTLISQTTPLVDSATRSADTTGVASASAKVATRLVDDSPGIKLLAAPKPKPRGKIVTAVDNVREVAANTARKVTPAVRNAARVAPHLVAVTPAVVAVADSIDIGGNSSSNTPPQEVPQEVPQGDVTTDPPGGDENDDTQFDIKIEKPDEYISVTFSDKVKSCQISEAYRDAETLEDVVKTLKTIESGAKYEPPAKRYAYVAQVRCKTEDSEYELASTLATSKDLKLSGKDEFTIYECEGDACPSDTTDANRMKPRYIPAPLQQIKAPNMPAGSSVPILNSL